MHDVQLHFGDLRKSWGRHSAEAVGLLFNLLCEYYDREGPLPADEETLEDLAGAETKAQKALLPKLLKRHLELTATAAGQVWKWARCDLEIARYKHRCAVNAHNNLLKFVGKSSGRLTAPSFDDFAARIDHYRDPVSGRFRNLGEAAPTGNNGTPKVSESETVGVPKIPTSGDHSPTLPLSHSPTLPITPPLVPQGGRDAAAAGALNPDFSKVDSDTSETGVSAGKKKKGAARTAEPLVWPDTWTGERRAVMDDWLRYKSEKGQRYKPTGFAALLRKLEGLPAPRLRAVVDASMAANWSGLFPERQESAAVALPRFQPRGALDVSAAFPSAMAANGAPLAAPSGYERAWSAIMGDDRTVPAWPAIDEAMQGRLRQWLTDEENGGVAV